MGICKYGGIFQAKVDELLGDTQKIKIYIGDILVFSKGVFFTTHRPGKNHNFGD